MRRRNLPNNKVVPESETDIAAQKIQALVRGRKARLKVTDVKLKATSHILLKLRMKVAALESVVYSQSSETLNNALNDITKHYSIDDEENLSSLPTTTKKNSTTRDQSSPSPINAEYTLAPSMWDVILILGTNEVGLLGSVYSAMLLMMNIGIQFVFCWIVIENFLSSTFDDNTILSFRSWRRNIAHSSDFMEDITEVSLASRICNGDSGLELSGAQASYHQQLENYITGRGTLMCILTIMMWLLTVVKELSSIVAYWKAVWLLPKGCGTILSDDASSVVQCCRARYTVIAIALICRTAIVVSLGYAGSAWLANTVSVTDLILNAVALEFVLCVDEIIYEALAPQRLKCVVDNFASSPMPLPPVTEWKGLDLKASSLFAFLTLIMVLFWHLTVIPFENRLKLADDALCAGELDFVYTVGKTGIPAWSKSSKYRNAEGKEMNAKSYGSNQWKSDDLIIKEDEKTLNFVKAVIDNLIDGYGTDRVVAQDDDDAYCGKSIYFMRVNQTASTPYCYSGICELSYCDGQYYLGMTDIYGNVIEAYSDADRYCCLAEQLKTPNLKGGRLSLDGFQSETISTAMDIWNSPCVDQIGPQTPYSPDQDDLIIPNYNLMAGSYSDIFEGKCGICPTHTPYCDPVLNQCTNISCATLADHCLEDSTAGVRARQFCPITCGCHNPSDQLVLTSPGFGCPMNCVYYSNYNEAVSEPECVDEPLNSTVFAEYIEEITRISRSWPGYWRDQWDTIVGPAVLSSGCEGIQDFLENPSFGQNFCYDGGTFLPIKPMSYLCPVACGCSSEMMWGCPSSCAVNVTSSS